MAKFGNRPANIHAPLGTTGEQIATHEGGIGYVPDAKAELFLLAATNMVSEDTFYEAAADRDGRFEKLVHQVVIEDADWVARFAAFLRTSLLMRSASIVLAAEYVRAGGPNGRRVVDAALQRPDEPGEMLAYWRSRHGRNLPAAIQRGVADAVRRLYTERNVVKYDGKANAWQFADVVEVIHPAPVAPWQATLFAYLLDKRHHHDAKLITDPPAEPVVTADDPRPWGPVPLPMLSNDRVLLAMPEDQRRAHLRDNPNALADAGWPWERLSGWLPGGMDAEAWEKAIPQMRVGALVKNLRNFDEAKISDAAVDQVITKLTDQAEVEWARLFPYQVWTAYEAAPSDNWKRALGKTLDLTTANIPDLSGGTLILIDTSSSMNGRVSGRSQMQRVEVAAVMAMATARRSANVDIVIFGTDSAPVNYPDGASVLAGVQFVKGLIGSVGHATYGHTALGRWFDPARHRRAFIFTDDQMHDSGHVDLSHVPVLNTYNLAGYRPQALPAGERGRYQLGGFSDAGFRLAPMLEAAGDAHWPF